ncbi:Uncharacterised protein [Citrobacter youngae]|uniref:Uncharacterized protein n=2 Tax=Enterobacteriaceae TaxID=543 RepID=A0ABN7GLC9_9ENTR|nr:Uncharacterised protein [Citrobacter youngae]CAC9135813.1 Uncharacterised protein [Citrobacter youngae]
MMFAMLPFLCIFDINDGLCITIDHYDNLTLVRFFYGDRMELTKENVALIAALGIFVGTLITSLTNYLQNSSRQSHEWRSERNRRKIEKGEQLYEALILYKKLLFANHMCWISCIDGHFKSEYIGDRSEEILNKNPEYKGVGDRIVLISGVYFPEINAMFDRSRDLLKPANSVFFKIQSGDVDDKKLAKNIILNAGHDFDKEANKILDCLSKEIRLL